MEKIDVSKKISNFTRLKKKELKCPNEALFSFTLRIRAGLSPKSSSFKQPRDINIELGRAVVVALLVEWSLPTSEICGLNPVIGKILPTNLFTHCIIEKTKIRIKRPGMAHL